MSCEEIKELIDGYADGELELVRSLSVERHIQVCQHCLRAHQNLKALRSTMHHESLYFRAPAALGKNIRSALRAESDGQSTRRRTSWRLLAVAASVALVAIATLTLVPRSKGPSGEDLVAQEVISNHVRSLMEPNHRVDVPSSDQHTVKPWFNGKLDFSPPVENPVDEGFPLIGGRLDYLGGRSVAALVYQRHEHYINLFVWPSGDAQKLTEKSVKRQGYNLIHWDKTVMEYWAISDLNEPKLQQFAETIQNRTPPHL